MPATRCRRVSPACAAKPTILIASTGNTQGMRLSTRPPSSAPSSAASKVDEGAEFGRCAAALVALAALAAAPSCSAGETSARGAAAGQLPDTGARRARRPAGRLPVGQRHTTGIVCGLSLRWSASGIGRSTRRCPRIGSSPACRLAAVSITSGVSGKKLERACHARRPAALDAHLRWLSATVRVLRGMPALSCTAAGAARRRRCRNRSCAARWSRCSGSERELAALGNALLAAHQPVGLELDVDGRREPMVTDGLYRWTPPAAPAAARCSRSRSWRGADGIFSGSGQAISPVDTPAGSVHVICVRRPESPAFFQ
jgi:hypothetical protein